MIVVRVELYGAVSGQVSELARAVIYNTGEGSADRGDYRCYTIHGRSREALDRNTPPGGRHAREGAVKDYPRQALHVWNLIARALSSMGYK